MGYRFTRAERAAIVGLKEYVLQHIQERLTIRELAGGMMMGEDKLAEGVTRFWGKHFEAHLRELRMETALKKLEDTDESVKVIAGACGYKSVKSFHRAFQRFYGFTPTRVRKVRSGN